MVTGFHVTGNLNTTNLIDDSPEKHSLFARELNVKGLHVAGMYPLRGRAVGGCSVDVTCNIGFDGI